MDVPTKILNFTIGDINGTAMEVKTKVIPTKETRADILTMNLAPLGIPIDRNALCSS